MGWQTQVSIRKALPTLEQQINLGGIELVTAVGRLIPRSLPAERLETELRDLLGRRGFERVRNAVAYDETGQAVATARGESRFIRTRGRSIETREALDAGVEIQEFEYEGIAVRSFRRTLEPRSSPGPANDGVADDGSPPPRLGTIEVYVSAAEISRARGDLARAMIVASISGCLLAMVAVLLLARWLTRPIRALVRDMRRVGAGDLDHQSPVTSSDELGDLAHAFNVMTRGLKEAQQLRFEQRARERELSLATEIQTRLFPDAVPAVAGYDIAGYSASAKEVGGDYYDFIPIDDARLGIVVADVSGKGVPAALVMTMTRSLLRLAATGDPSAARTIERVDRALAPDLRPGMFVTLAYAVLDRDRHTIELVRCGHNSPYYFERSTQRLRALSPGGIGIGVDRTGALFSAQLRTQRLSLDPGDTLVLYTDGVVEAKDTDGRDYGDDRFLGVLRETVGATPEDVVDRTLADLEVHRAAEEPSDDVTMVVVQRRG